MTGLRKTIGDVEVADKRVLVRVDFNVPLVGGKVGDDTRIRAALPSLRALLDAGAAVVVASHFGRPKGKVVEEMRLRPVAARLAELLPENRVIVADTVVGPGVTDAAHKLKPGEVLLLENLRFDPGETGCEAGLAHALAGLADLFVQDAFGTCHRAHASTAGVPRLLKPAVAGLLLQSEIVAFDNALSDPKRPLVAVLGGAKVSDKIQVVENLLDKVNTLVIGGGMAYTFLRVRGGAVGNSLLEEEHLETALSVLSAASKKGVEILLPEDHVIADRFAADANTQIVDGDIPDGWMGLDIGPKTVASYAAVLAKAGTVVWNGPMGVFEMEPFREGTAAVARAVAESEAWSVVGGGDSVAAIDLVGYRERVSHISTGGGAFLEMLEGKELPGIAALDPA